VTVASSPDVLPQYAADAPGLLTLPFRTSDEFSEILDDPRKNAVLVGPGGGVSRTTHDIVLASAAQGKTLVLDADALTVFEPSPAELFSALGGIPCVLTPHEGEFSRLFKMTGDKLTRARKAAAQAKAVVLLKGADTVIAAPDGRAAINFNAPPSLATAGAGDVLSGTILGLVAQGMPAFEASCAAAWISGDVASAFGPGLVAEDIYQGIPASLARLQGLERKI
jgi:ADP-dependent NAD(P)H-hydrate dehydratase / NAD(P)H-hydrate epimerase